MNCFDWRFDDQVTDNCMTIEDITSVDVGESIDVLLLHRNAYDVPCTIHPFDIPMNPTEFFSSRATFKRTEGMKGTLTEEEIPTYPTELEIEYTPGWWYPLTDGYIPAVNEDTEQPLLGRRMHWTEFPESTRVGFRGPMIMWSDAMILPHVYNPRPVPLSYSTRLWRWIWHLP
jgi:hypothetical protein